jgi:hypothetical protein
MIMYSKMPAGQANLFVRDDCAVAIYTWAGDLDPILRPRIKDDSLVMADRASRLVARRRCA